MMNSKAKKWFKPVFDFDDDNPPKKNQVESKEKNIPVQDMVSKEPSVTNQIFNSTEKNWMKTFDPKHVEELAVNLKKVQEVEHWLTSVVNSNGSEMLLLSGPVGCGKTITVQRLANKHNIKITEWVTPVDIDIPTDYGDYEFREKQSKKFMDFIISAANFSSLLDGNTLKMVLVEDFPNTFMRTPSEFIQVLEQYKGRAKSPIVFICSEMHTDNKNTSVNLFTPSLKEQFNIHHISFNSISATGLKSALKRVSEIITKKYSTLYNTPSPELIDCVIHSSAGDVRSAVLNLHFASLKGGQQKLETSFVKDKENKSKTRKKKQASSKFLSLGKDQTVSILHGVGRVLNPKVISEGPDSGRLSHAPAAVMEQFTSQPMSFVNFAAENYLPHFSCAEHAALAAAALSVADCLLAEWREKKCQEYGLYVATAGLMLANKAPVSAWNPVRGPKAMKIQYPTPSQMPLLDRDCLYKGKVLVTDYKTYCNIISGKT